MSPRQLGLPARTERRAHWSLSAWHKEPGHAGLRQPGSKSRERRLAAPHPHGARKQASRTSSARSEVKRKQDQSSSAQSEEASRTSSARSEVEGSKACPCLPEVRKQAGLHLPGVKSKRSKVCPRLPEARKQANGTSCAQSKVARKERLVLVRLERGSKQVGLRSPGAKPYKRIKLVSFRLTDRKRGTI